MSNINITKVFPVKENKKHFLKNRIILIVIISLYPTKLCSCTYCTMYNVHT